MKKLTTTLAIGILVATAVMTMAGSVPEGVHKDAQWFAKMDIAKLKKTTIGDKMMEKMNGEEAENKFAAMSTMLKFDPREDIDSVLLYGSGKQHDGVAIIKGSFDKEQLTTLVKGAEDYKSEDYLSYTIHTWKDTKHGVDGKRSTGCIYDAKTLVFADDVASMKEAVDLLDGRGKALEDADRFPGLAGLKDASFLFAAANIADMEVHPEAATFRSAKSLVFGIGESDGMINASVAVETPNAETAMSYKAILDGMKALALLNVENNPEGALLAKNSSVAQKDSSLTISVRSSVEDVLAHIAKKKERMKTRMKHHGFHHGRRKACPVSSSGE